MKLLSKLTPAETLLLRDGSQASVKNLLKYTFMDLLRKQILIVEEVQHQRDKRDPVTTLKYVSAGTNFNEYAAFAHELPFLEPFQKNRGARILFRNCIEIAYENAGSQTRLPRTVMSTPELHESFSTSWLNRVFGRIRHTDKGRMKQNEVQTELTQLERELPILIKNNKQKALETIEVIGGNVFLFHDLNFAMLQEIDDAFPKRMESYIGDGGCGSWDSHPHGSHSDGSCWGDSSDSGCSSGDSGCGGGCGGCGGGD